MQGYCSEGRSSIPLPMRLRVATTPRGFEWAWQVSLQGYCSWLSHLKMQMRQCKSWKGRKRRKRRKWRCQIEKGLGGGRAMKAKAQHGSHIREIWTRAAIFRGGKNWEKFPGISQWRSIEVTTWLCDFKAAMLLSQHRCVDEDGVMDCTHTHTHTWESRPEDWCRRAFENMLEEKQLHFKEACSKQLGSSVA